MKVSIRLSLRLSGKSLHVRKSKINNRVDTKSLNLDKLFDDQWMSSLENPSLSPDEWMEAFEKCIVSEENEIKGDNP